MRFNQPIKKISFPCGISHNITRIRLEREGRNIDIVGERVGSNFERATEGTFSVLSGGGEGHEGQDGEGEREPHHLFLFFEKENKKETRKRKRKEKKEEGKKREKKKRGEN